MVQTVSQKRLFCLNRLCWVNIIKETFIFYALLLYVFSHFFAGPRFVVVFLDSFLHLGDKKVVAGCIRLVVVLNSNKCMGIWLGNFSIGHVRQVVVIDKWLSYRGGHFNRFDCILLVCNSFAHPSNVLQGV